MSRTANCLALVLVAFASGTSLAESPAERIVTGTVRDARAKPVVALIALEQSPLIFNDRSDAEGRFKIVVAAGTRALVFDAAGYQRRRVATLGGNEPLAVVLEDEAVIRVAALNSKGRPYKAAMVCAKNESVPGAETKTCEMEHSASDVCPFLGLAPGKYRVWVCGHPNIPAQRVDVTPQRPALLTLRQPKGSTLVVRVIDKAGERVDFPGAVLVQGNVSYPATEAAFKAAEADMFWPDSEERPTFTGLAPGEHTLWIPMPRCRDNVSVSRRVVLPRAGTSQVTVRLPFAYAECP